VAQQRASTRQHDALVDDVRGELGRGALEADAHRFDDLVDRLEQRVADLLVGDLDRLRHPRDQVAALDLHYLELAARIFRAVRYLAPLRGALADYQLA